MIILDHVCLKFFHHSSPQVIYSPFTINTHRSLSFENIHQAFTMTRKKVALGWIANDSARKASLKKRRSGLIKKVSELCILCGVVACVIIYSPNEIEPIFLPSSRSEVEEILLRFERVPEMEKNRKMMNQESYIKERATKHEDQLRKNMKKNQEMQMNHFLHQIHRAAKPYNEFAHPELHGLRFYMEERWRECRRRMQFFHQAPGEQLPPPAHILCSDTEMEQAREHDVAQWDTWFIKMTKNDQNVAGSSGTDKGKAVLHAYEGSSSCADGTVAPYNHLGSSIWGNEAMLSDGNMGDQGGIHGFGVPQGQAGDIGEGQIAPAPHGVNGGTTVGYGFEPHHGNNEAVGFGQSMVFPHGEVGGGRSEHNIGKQEWNVNGIGNGHGFLLPYQDAGHSNWIYSMNPPDPNTGGGESGHAMMPLYGGIQGSLEGCTWRQQDWNRAADKGYGTVFPNPYGDVGGSSVLNGMKECDWNAGSNSSVYSMVLPRGDAAANTDAYGPNFYWMNTQGTGMGLGLMLPQGEGRSGVYGMELHQRNGGSSSIEQQGNVLIPGDAGTNGFSTGLYPQNHMSIEEPYDQWARHYSAGGTTGPSNVNQNPGA